LVVIIPLNSAIASLSGQKTTNTIVVRFHPQNGQIFVFTHLPVKPDPSHSAGGHHCNQVVTITK
jgi:hypothetical protein